MTDISFKLHIIGQIKRSRNTKPLTILAEFGESKIVERTDLSFDTLSQDIQNLTGFIEVSTPPSFTQNQLISLGSDLFKAIMPRNVKTLFDNAAGHEHRMLPVEIYIEDNELASWPWEYLYNPSTQTFMCQEHYPISRGIFSLKSGREFSNETTNVKILLVVGEGSKDPTLTPEEEISWIKGVFGTHLANDSVRIKVMQTCKPEDLQKELDSNSYDIVHFWGHAGYNLSRKEAYLKLDNPEQSSRPYHFYANEFGRLLIEKGIRLVFLNACETGKASKDSPNARNSIAAAVLDRGIPAVIATQFSISDSSSHYLSSIIYNSLAAGKPLFEAVRSGRNAMSYAEEEQVEEQFYDWGIPVLYARKPDLIIFPRDKAKQIPAWSKVIEESSSTSGVIRGFSNTISPDEPSSSVKRTVESSNKSAKVKIALIDFDAKVSLLPELIEAANKAQTYYAFQVAYLPFPSGAIRTDIAGQKVEPQFYIPRVEEYLATKPDELNVDKICCLTRHLIAGKEWNGKFYWNYFSSGLADNCNVFVISSYDMRSYSQSAGVSFEKSMLYLCLSMLLRTDSRWSLNFHEETKGCLFDMCENRDDVVVGLQRMSFDHRECREKVRDMEVLEAIDSLFTLNDPKINNDSTSVNVMDDRKNSLQEQYELLNQQLHLVEIDRIIETDTLTRFKFEKQIETIKANIADIEEQLREL